jgi:uncharacterized RmlC-like cupin family protein
MVLFLNVTVCTTGVGQTRERMRTHTKAWHKETTFPAVSWESFAHVSNTLKERAKRERERDDIFVPVMVPRMCANESPTSSTDTPEALSEAISRSSFDKRLVSM